MDMLLFRMTVKKKELGIGYIDNSWQKKIDNG